MQAKYLKFIIPFLTILAIFVLLFTDKNLNIVAIFSIIFMFAGFNYALFRHLNSSHEEKRINKILTIDKFESEIKIAKPLRFLGLISFILLIIVWLDLVSFKYSDYLSLLVICFLLPYILLWVYHFNKRLKSTNE